MATYKELLYMVMDKLKISSDDSYFQKEHVLFLLDKHRSFLLKQVYEKNKQEIPESSYQTICIDLERVGERSDFCNLKDYLKSTKKIPNTLNISSTKLSTMDYFSGDISYVDRERFKYVGTNKFLKNTIYGTIAPDEYLYLKSNNPQAYYLKKVKLTGIFEDALKAAALSCDGEDEGSCDVLDKNFPIEEALIPQLIQTVVQDLSASVYSPADDTNNANDDLSAIANFLNRHLKKGWTKDGQ